MAFTLKAPPTPRSLPVKSCSRLAPNVTTYSDTSVYPGETFYYRVTAFNSSGDSPPSNVVNVALSPGPSGIPAAPSGLTANAISAAQVNLLWVDNSSNETGFLVERDTDASFTASLVSFPLGANVQAYCDLSVSGGTAYYYRVSSFNADGSSAESNTATATTPAGGGGSGRVPAGPSGLTAIVVTSHVNLSWQDNSTDETGFRLERASDAAFILAIVAFVLPADTTSLADNTTSALSTYHYRVFAFNATGDSTSSNVATVTTGGGSVPTAPTRLTAQAAGPTMVNLGWVETYSNQSGFRLERAADPAFSQGLVSFQVGINTLGYTDATVLPSATYYYRVFAFNASGDSPASNVAPVTTPAIDAMPTAPSDLAAIAINPNQINLRWRDNSNNEAGFRIERASDSPSRQTLYLFRSKWMRRATGT